MLSKGKKTRTINIQIKIFICQKLGSTEPAKAKVITEKKRIKHHTHHSDLSLQVLCLLQKFHTFTDRKFAFVYRFAVHNQISLWLGSIDPSFFGLWNSIRPSSYFKEGLLEWQQEFLRSANKFWHAQWDIRFTCEEIGALGPSAHSGLGCSVPFFFSALILLCNKNVILLIF
ncbi:uncharacterized protein LOC114271256 [Camellia sinensis]|uniref:uncharacterized protein LOC114271256 n=1 Tax=Camellia sinensis TaxID=4442 RepID=UPI0010362801|nr:uncharacterized protein LOC114271256 [Camellia sinensis]